MARIEKLLEQEVVAAEVAEHAVDLEAPLPAGSKVTRGSARTRNVQVRLRDEEFEGLSAFAAEQGLPVSTVIRMLVLRCIAPVDDLKSALDRLETDLAAVRRKALSA